ncbi:hypothetical protein ACJJTC_003739 [Scirpophaga incertulas]
MDVRYQQIPEKWRTNTPDPRQIILAKIDQKGRPHAITTILWPVLDASIQGQQIPETHLSAPSRPRTQTSEERTQTKSKGPVFCKEARNKKADLHAAQIPTINIIKETKANVPLLMAAVNDEGTTTQQEEKPRPFKNSRYGRSKI